MVTGLIRANIAHPHGFYRAKQNRQPHHSRPNGRRRIAKYGDSLFLQPGNAEPTRLQGAFVSDDEVHQIVAHIKRQAPTNYIEGLLSGEAALETANTVSPNADSDELFDQAVAFVLESRAKPPSLRCSGNCAWATTVPPT